MLLKAPNIEIIKEDPFKNDLLARKESADILTELIKSFQESVVLCIDAAWGDGKTTFLRMWRQHLINDGFATLYFNAWENDFSDDALVSLIGEIDGEIGNIKKAKGTSSKAKAHFEKAKKLGVGLVKRTLPVAAKLATAGALDLDKITEEALSNLSSRIAEDQIRKYESSKKTVHGFRKELTSFANEVANDNDGKPLIFIIDELDRCRPLYAIEVLEKAKHFFSVPNIIFIVAVDKSQIGHSIRSVYGHGMDMNGYLKRFIDIDYILPAPQKGVFPSALFNRFGLTDYFDKKLKYQHGRNENSQISKIFPELFLLLNLSLREQEHCFSQLSLVIRTTPENFKLYPLLLCTLIVLKIKEPLLYKDFISGKSDAKKVITYLREKPGGELFIDSNYGYAIEAYLVSCRSRHYRTGEFVAPYTSIIDNPESTEGSKKRAKYIIDLLNTFDIDDGIGILDYLVKKIEIASRFYP